MAWRADTSTCPWRSGAFAGRISVAGLRKSYGAVQAVRGVSFTVARGEIFALLGPNGAGKTTTRHGLRQAQRRPATHRHRWLQLPAPDGRTRCPWRGVAAFSHEQDRLPRWQQACPTGLVPTSELRLTIESGALATGRQAEFRDTCLDRPCIGAPGADTSQLPGWIFPGNREREARTRSCRHG
jgi:hypothetical protein